MAATTVKQQKPILHGRDHEHGGADVFRIAWETAAPAFLKSVANPVSWNPTSGAVDRASVIYDAIATQTSWYFEFEVYAPQALYDAIAANVTTSYIFLIDPTTGVTSLNPRFGTSAVAGVPKFVANRGGTTESAPLTPDTWTKVILRRGGPAQIGAWTSSSTLDAALNVDITAGSVALGLQQTHASWPTPQTVWLRNVKYGTSEGGSELLRFDDNSSDLSIWNGATMDGPTGPTFYISIGDPAYDETGP